MASERVTERRLWMAMAALLLTATFGSFARGVVMETETAAPWVIALAGCLTMLLLWPTLAALARRPGKNLVDLAVAAGGRPLAIVVTLGLCGAILIAAGLILREVSEMSVTALYPHTPQTFLMTSLIVAAGLGAAMSPAGLIWLGALYFAPVVLSLALLIIGDLGWINPFALVPLAGPGLVGASLKAVPLTSYFGELVVLTIVVRYLAPAGNPVRIAVKSVGTVICIWAAILALYLMLFPYPQAIGFPFPVYELSRLIQGGRFLERLDELWIVFWSFGAAGRLGTLLMAGSLLFRDAFRLPTHRAAVLPLTVATLAIALFPVNQADTIVGFRVLVGRWGFIPFLALPLLLTLVAEIRRRAAHA